MWVKLLIFVYMKVQRTTIAKTVLKKNILDIKNYIIKTMMMQRNWNRIDSPETDHIW